MAKRHKDQHWIPKSYLRAWVDPDTPARHEPFVHVFSREGAEHRTKAPANLFSEIDLYTIKLPDGGRDLRLEHGLSGLETAFSVIRKDFLAKRRQLSVARRVKLLAFVAAMHARTPSIRNHHMKFWTDVQNQMERLDKHMKAAPPEERMRAAQSSIPGRDKKRSMSLDDVKRITSSPMEHTVGPYITAELPYLMQMRCMILCTTSDPGFITSDAPVVWFDSEWYKKPPMFRSQSFSDPLLEITLPLSPGRLLLIAQQHPEMQHLQIEYIDVPDHIVDEMNRRTRFNCDKEFVVRRQVTHPHWFDRGVPPADTWEATHAATDTPNATGE